MTSRERPADIGARRSSTILSSLGDEIHDARMSHGMSQARLAALAGVSQAVVSRIERRAQTQASVNDLARLLAVVGLELSARAYPAGTPIVDAAQRKLLDRLRDRTHPSLKWRFELPLPIAGDQRAWDAVIEAPGQGRVAVEAETKLRNLQALQRRVALKLRDDPTIGAVILLVAGTRANREVMRAEGDALVTDFPLSGRAILESLGDGRLPAASGIVVLEPKSRTRSGPGATPREDPRP